MEPTVAALILEFAKLGLQGVFAALRQVGKTEEEIAEYTENIRRNFFQSDPGDLPDPESTGDPNQL
jgi:hypothetical protein